MSEDPTSQNFFRVGITPDLKSEGGAAFGDIGVDLLEKNPCVRVEYLPDFGPDLPLEVANEFDALLVMAPSVTAKTVDGSNRLSVVARFGVGYDSVDVEACSRNDVLLTITPDGVRRPVAVSAIALLLALSHKLLIKDRLTRDGRWNEKLDYMGTGLTGRTLGLIGLGNIGTEILKLASVFDMRLVAYDPFVSESVAAESGAELLSIENVLQQSDFVCVCCALTDDTHHLINAERLGTMKPSAYLINIARGPIVDQAALTEALRARRIAGAALDVFEKEPIDPNDPLLGFDNVILSPHAIAWSDELFRGIGRAACQSILDVASGLIPKHVVNAKALERPTMQAKLAQYANASRRS